MPHFERITVIDSHAGGEPTRVIVAGGPDLGEGTVAERAARFDRVHADFRRRVIGEPRGSQSIVGALLVQPSDPACAAGVIYFDNGTVLGMCGHGTIGLVVTLGHLGRLAPGEAKLETPAGVIRVTLHDEHRVTLRNVPSYRIARQITLDVPGLGPVAGDIAYGGNVFFIAPSPGIPIDIDHHDALATASWKVRRALERVHSHREPIDHISLTGPPSDPGNHSRHYVLCPSGTYDRSPCGTGTSARLACLAADGTLRPGEVWRQESVTGSVFEASYELHSESRIIPHITGSAYLTSEATLLIDRDDPLPLRPAIRSDAAPPAP